MKIIIARSKINTHLILNTDRWSNFDTFQTLNTTSSQSVFSKAWMEEDKSTGLVDSTASYCDFVNPNCVYKHIRNLYRHALRGRWQSRVSLNANDLPDKKYQIAFWNKWGKEISVETWEVNFKSGTLILKESKDLAEYYPNRISHIN